MFKRRKLNTNEIDDSYNIDVSEQIHSPTNNGKSLHSNWSRNTYQHLKKQNECKCVDCRAIQETSNRICETDGLEVSLFKLSRCLQIWLRHSKPEMKTAFKGYPETKLEACSCFDCHHVQKVLGYEEGSRLTIYVEHNAKN
ncbi:uncharacterized protein LOC102808622 [Saccoglossus kowalevskii]|uniref:Uncharacterized protein LOC102808622 n=1 Tax=Saccoglossus kowalevskii TaxID=10224 RepID=A0ABM0LV88_SACKO|nr:PREDICTED: uncharacterized protein LOC102808622 [Saccoglossus kowalevskii]